MTHLRRSSRSWIVTVACAVALALAAQEPARASSMVHLDLETLSNTAEFILVGTVEKTQSHFTSPRSHTIVTDVTIDVERRILGGSVGDRFVVRHLGGEVAGLGQRIYGEASYTPGERVLVFTVERNGAQYALGMAQGVFHVFADSTGIARVEARVAEVDLIGPGAITPAEPRRLNDVVAQVQSLVARRPAVQTAH